MKSFNLSSRVLALVALALLVAGGAYAQLQAGNLYGTVTDDKGAALPGVTVTVTGNGPSQVQVTNAQGQVRFLSLSPGSFQLKAELEGFSTIDYPNIVINVGRNTSIEMKLSAAVEDVITVTAESPLLDSRKISTGATVSQTELEKIPTARDPWAILQSTPGVLTDRINVGGNESGQQATYVGPGSGGDQSIWSVDGVVITDMAATGSTPSYFDFDAFEEMQVTTGGSDSTIATGGVVLNLVTKRGTNEWRGSGRFNEARDSWQAKSNIDNSEFGRDYDGTLPSSQGGGVGTQAAFSNGNRLVLNQDYGAEVGGPIVRDRLFAWASYAKQKVSILTAANAAAPGGLSDKTTLKTWNVKLNGQLAANNSATLFASNNDKIKLGRNAGPTRPQETTWDQGHFGAKPTIEKLEDTHIFSSNFYLTGLYSRVEGGFQLIPEGGITLGTAGESSYIDGAAVWHNSFLFEQIDRPQKQGKLDASTFFNTGAYSHELKFGAGYRTATASTTVNWPGVGIVLDASLEGTDSDVLAAARAAQPNNKQTFESAYVQDTLTMGNLTANVGLRYDKQTADNLPVSVAGNPALPADAPLIAVNYNGSDPTPSWTSLTPRLGITYALGADRKTLLRASYSRFADQMSNTIAGFLNPLGTNAYAYFYTTGPHATLGHVTPADVGDFLGYTGNVNPLTGGVLQSNGQSSHLSPPKTDEVLLSVEHALLPEFVVGLNLTYRKLTNLIQNDLLVFDGTNEFCASCLNSIGRVATSADYDEHTKPTVLPNGQLTTVHYFLLKPSLSTRVGAYEHNGDDEQEYKGASLTLNKRLANRWMMRGNVTYSDWTWSKISGNPDPTEISPGGNREGDPVIQGSGNGSGNFGQVFVNSKWAYSLNGLYQVAPDRPWGFNTALSLNGRQGYPNPYFLRITTPTNYAGQPVINPLVPSSPDQFRNDNIRTVDARLEKEFTFSDVGLTLGLDCFNLLNANTVLQRQNRLSRSNSNFVFETLSPRVFRLGAKISFR